MSVEEYAVIGQLIGRVRPALDALRYYVAITRGFRDREQARLALFLKDVAEEELRDFTPLQIKEWLKTGAGWVETYGGTPHRLEAYMEFLRAIPPDLLQRTKEYAQLIASGSGRRPVPVDELERLASEFSPDPSVALRLQSDEDHEQHSVQDGGSDVSLLDVQFAIHPDWDQGPQFTCGWAWPVPEAFRACIGQQWGMRGKQGSRSAQWSSTNNFSFHVGCVLYSEVSAYLSVPLFRSDRPVYMVQVEEAMPRTAGNEGFVTYRWYQLSEDRTYRRMDEGLRGCSQSEFIHRLMYGLLPPQSVNAVSDQQLDEGS